MRKAASRRREAAFFVRRLRPFGPRAGIRDCRPRPRTVGVGLDDPPRPAQERRDLVQGPGPRGVVLDQTALPDRLGPDLELRLDQGDQLGPSAGQAESSRQRLGQADEADVGDDQVRRIGYQGGGQTAGVDALQRDHPWIAGQAGMQLAAADVDGVDPGRAALQADLGEPAGRGADVQHRAPLQRHRPQVEGADQLQGPAADIGMGGDRLDGRTPVDHVGGLGEGAPVDAHPARLDGGAGLGAAVEQALFDQDDIRAFLAQACLRRVRPAPRQRASSARS